MESFDAGFDCFTLDELFDQSLETANHPWDDNLFGVKGGSEEDPKLSPSHSIDSGMSSISSPRFVPDYTDPSVSISQPIVPHVYGGNDDLLAYIMDDDDSNEPMEFQKFNEENDNVTLNNNVLPVVTSPEPQIEDGRLTSIDEQFPTVDFSDLESNNDDDESPVVIEILESEPLATPPMTRSQSHRLTSRVDAHTVRKSDVAFLMKAVNHNRTIPSSKSPGKFIQMEPKPELNRNAKLAKENREKKKAYINELEGSVHQLSEENSRLKSDSGRMRSEVLSLEQEVEYLRNVIANQSSLSSLLTKIPNINKVTLTTSFQRKRDAEHDHDYPSRAAKSPKRQKRSSTVSGGVCLHVDKENVSLEFCSSCSKMACGNGRD